MKFGSPKRGSLGRGVTVSPFFLENIRNFELYVMIILHPIFEKLKQRFFSQCYVFFRS